MPRRTARVDSETYTTTNTAHEVAGRRCWRREQPLFIQRPDLVYLFGTALHIVSAPLGIDKVTKDAQTRMIPTPTDGRVTQ